MVIVLRRKSPKTTLEFALIADGVPPKDVYKVLAQLSLPEVKTAEKAHEINGRGSKGLHYIGRARWGH